MMNDTMDLTSNRRELRRQKILQNAEARKQKIFGLDSKFQKDIGQTHNDIREACNEIGDFNETESIDSELSSKSFAHNESNDSIRLSDIARLSEILKNIPDPIAQHPVNETIYSDQEPVEEFSNHSNHLTSGNAEHFSSIVDPNFCNLDSSGESAASTALNGFTKSKSSSSDLSISESHPGSPFFLSLVVCILMTMNLGNLVSNNLVLPFLIWKIQQMMAALTVIESKEEASSFLNAALLILGLNRNFILNYLWILKALYKVLVDSALYFSTIILWHAVIGFSV